MPASRHAARLVRDRRRIRPGRALTVSPVLDGLLVPAALGASRDRVLAVVADEVGSGLGHVHEDSGEQIAGVEGLFHLGPGLLGPS